MSTTLVPQLPLIETLDQLLERLGDIGPERIYMRPPPGTATEADVLAALEAPRKRICELIDGVLVEKAMGYRECLLAGYLHFMLEAFVRPRNLGLVTVPDGTIRLWAGRVRAPDVAFFPWDCFPDRRVPEEPIPTLVPDLAVEVLSISNTPREMLFKRQDLFGVGVRLIWEINPRTRTASIFLSPEQPTTILTEVEILDGSPVLPGFKLPLRDLFAELERHG